MEPSTTTATTARKRKSKKDELNLESFKEVGEIRNPATANTNLEPATTELQLPEIDSLAVLGQHEQLDDLAELLAIDSHSLLSHTYNPNNNTFILDYVIRRLSGGKASLGSLRLFTINWDIMMSKCPAKSMLRPSERADFQYPIYEFPDATLPDGQQAYLIDFQKMRYRTYPIILALVEYLVSTRSFIARRRKPLLLLYHMECCLESYWYKFSLLLERYPEHYYWMIHGGTESPNLLRHKFMSMFQYYPVRIDLPGIAPHLLHQTPVIGKQKDLAQIQKIIWDLTDRDLLKTMILSENIITYTEITQMLPLCQILTEFIQGLKAIKHMNDLVACYRVAYKINTLGYSIARLGRTLTGMLKWHRQTKAKFAPDFTVLASDKNWPRVIKLFADYEPGKYKDKNEQIPIFQNLMIDLARIQLGG